MSPEFREVYGALVNAQMRLRQGVQREVEQACAQLGMPTRSEVDAAHRKIAELERALRRMRDAADPDIGNTQGASAASRAKPAGKPAGKKAPAKPAAKAASTRKAAKGKQR